MLISTLDLFRVYRVSPSKVLHVGAHLGEEARDYEKAGWLPVIWIEANPEIANSFRELNLGPQHSLIEAAIWSKNDVEKELNISTNSQSSSFLNLGTHSDTYPDITFTHSVKVKTKRLDSFFSKETIPDFINLDIQGVELQAIEGLGELINQVKWIYVEVNRQEVYEGCTHVRELDDFLSEKGFYRTATRWIIPAGWGDALYINRGQAQSKKFSIRLLELEKSLLFYLPKMPSLIRYSLKKIMAVSRIR